MASDITLPAAALAGLLSFLSPCVLPLVPPYLCYLAGTTLEDLVEGADQTARSDALRAGFLFVLGFSTVFVLLGATASALGTLVRQYLDVFGWLAGGLIILMGLHFLGFFQLPLIARESRLRVERTGLGSAYLMGLAFAFGWTPCIGPILGAILAVAGSQETVGRGALLLATYSAGLGVPFMAAAFAMGPMVVFMKRFRSYFGALERVVGACLVLTGLLFLTGGIQKASFWLLDMFPALATLG
jgi:cytochrome c-type biogenesis protein